MRLCAVTNVWNESFNLPLWLDHYGRQVGRENCLVVDHGSDDGSTDDLGGAGVFRIPRGTSDQVRRAQFIGDLVTALLRVYDAVVYSDADELLVADPARWASLADYATAMPAPGATAIGLDVLHGPGEPPLDRKRPLLAQRRNARFSVPMCKTLLVRAPVRWAAGFHASDLPPHFGDLYLFHLRWLDRDTAHARLAQTRTIDRADPAHGAHQRLSDEAFDRRLARWTGRAVRGGFDFAGVTARLAAGTAADAQGLHWFPPDLRHPGLWHIPARFVDALP